MGFDDALLPSIDQDDTRRTGIGEGAATPPPTTAWGAYGARYYRQLNTAYHWVVKITKGGSTWLFSDTDMKIADGHVHALLDGGVSIDSKVDLVTKQWSVQDVRLLIKNIQYRQDITTHDWVQYSDEVGSIRGGLIDIYVLAGPQPSALSDGLLIFSGEISEPAVITKDHVELVAGDAARRKNKVLPLRYVTENGSWTGIPSLSRLRKIPITYGEFSKAFDNSVDLGLARAELISDEDSKKYACSDHIMHTLSEGFIQHRELPMPSKIVSPTLDADDSGYGTAVMGGVADARMYAENSDIGDFITAGYPGTTVDCGNAGDLIATTKARAWRTPSGSGGVNMFLGFRDYANNEKNTLTPIGKIIGELVSGTYYGYLKFKVKKINILTSPQPPEVSLKVGNVGGSDVTLDISTFTDDSDITAKFAVTEIANVLWHLRSGDSTYTTDDRPLLFRIFFDGTLPVGEVGNDALWCYYCYLLWRYRPFYIGSAFVSGKGMKFGSWIDTAGRSNSYSAGDLIEDPAFIIESILRDQLGLVDADIDTDSFDAAADADIKARIQFHSDNEMDAFSAIRQLAEQSRFAVVITGNSKVRLIPLNVTSPTIARTLHVADIDIDSLQYSKDPRIINLVRIKHRWQEEHADFKDYITYGNQVEFTEFYPVDFKWKNITDGLSGSVLAVGGFIRDTWGVQHNKITFTCPGIANIDLSVGDWIQLDPTSIDPHLLCYGASWSGKKFLIYRARYTDKQTTIEAIQLI